MNFMGFIRGQSVNIFMGVATCLVNLNLMGRVAGNLANQTKALTSEEGLMILLPLRYLILPTSELEAHNMEVKILKRMTGGKDSPPNLEHRI